MSKKRAILNNRSDKPFVHLCLITMLFWTEAWNDPIGDCCGVAAVFSIDLILKRTDDTLDGDLMRDKKDLLYVNRPSERT